jgi:hypothetical protein
MKIWRPKDPKAVALIKIVLWAGLTVWIIFTLAFGIVMAKLAAVSLPSIIGTGTWAQVWTWVIPIWIIFTTLLLIWAVARFANKKLRKKEEIEEE